MYNLFDVLLIKFTILVGVQLFELFSEKILIFMDGTVEEARNELSVVYLSGMVKVHCVKDLLNVNGSEVAIYLLSEIVQTHIHFLFGDHAVPI